MVDVVAFIQLITSVPVSDYINVLNTLDDKWLFIGIIVLSMFSGLIAVYYTTILFVKMLKCETLYKTAIEHVQLALLYVGVNVSFVFWLVYHPAFNCVNRDGTFNAGKYITHIHYDVIYSGMVFSWAFVILFSLLFAQHLKRNIKFYDEYDKDKK